MDAIRINLKCESLGMKVERCFMSPAAQKDLGRS